MSYYPTRVDEHFKAPANSGDLIDANADAVGASFVCGSFVSMELRVDDERGSIDEARFRTNGCGFMTAAADVVCGWLTDKALSDLHGLSESELMAVITNQLGEFPANRIQCTAVVFETLRRAMAVHRTRRIEEFQGEKAVVCTCFGVSEETILDVISNRSVATVDDVSDACRAGSGCGSCQMLIAELLDARG